MGNSLFLYKSFCFQVEILLVIFSLKGVFLVFERSYPQFKWAKSYERSSNHFQKLIKKQGNFLEGSCEENSVSTLRWIKSMEICTCGVSDKIYKVISLKQQHSHHASEQETTLVL